MKHLELALIDYNPETFELAWTTASQWGHSVELPITKPELLKPSVEMIRLGSVAVDMIVCNRSDINDKWQRYVNALTKKPTVRYEESEIQFYQFMLPPDDDRNINNTFDRIYQLPRLD